MNAREKILFPLYKDKDIHTVKGIENDVQKHYGFMPSKEFTREILNYKTKKYGYYSSGKERRAYVKHFTSLGAKRSKYTNTKAKEKYHLDRLIERAENDYRKRQNSGGMGSLEENK